jgi:hypothetical protein
MMASNTSKVRTAIAAAAAPVSCRELAALTGLAGDKVSMCLQQLERDGTIEKATTARPHRYRPRTAAAPAADTAPDDGPVFAFFIDDDGDLQICRRDGEGDGTVIARAEALRLADFLARLRPVLEAA